MAEVLFDKGERDKAVAVLERGVELLKGLRQPARLRENHRVGHTKRGRARVEAERRLDHRKSRFGIARARKRADGFDAKRRGHDLDPDCPVPAVPDHQGDDR